MAIAQPLHLAIAPTPHYSKQGMPSLLILIPVWNIAQKIPRLSVKRLTDGILSLFRWVCLWIVVEPVDSGLRQPCYFPELIGVLAAPSLSKFFYDVDHGHHLRVSLPLKGYSHSDDISTQLEYQLNGSMMKKQNPVLSVETCGLGYSQWSYSYDDRNEANR